MLILSLNSTSQTSLLPNSLPISHPKPKHTHTHTHTDQGDIDSKDNNSRSNDRSWDKFSDNNGKFDNRFIRFYIGFGFGLIWFWFQLILSSIWDGFYGGFGLILSWVWVDFGFPVGGAGL